MKLIRVETVYIACIAALLIVSCGEKRTEITTETDSTHEHAGSEAGHSDEHAGHSESEEGHGHEKGEHSENEPITLTAEAMQSAGITVATVSRSSVAGTISAPGRVIPAQNATGHIGSLITGRVARILRGEGSSVAKGTVVAELEAFDIGELRAEYASAAAAVTQAKLTLDRQERLSGEGIGAKRALDEARSAYTQAVARQRAAEAKLQSLGISPSELQGSSYSTRVSIRSPLSGVITKQHVVVGEYVDPSRDMFEVVNLSTVWVEAQVSPLLARELRIGTKATLRGQTGERGIGSVNYISPTVEAESRTVPVRVLVNNTTSQLKPQSFVTVDFERQSGELALSIPRTAIEQDGEKQYVYLQEGPTTFKRQEILLGSSTGTTVVVLSGLAEGDKIAEKGVFYLKSIRQKGELQEHEH